MSNERLVTIAEVLMVASLGVGIILLALILTLFFRKIAEVERRIATPGKQLDGIRQVWGNGPIGRWMRVVHVYCFFVFRNLPRVGPRIESRMGDEKETLPFGLKLWATVPVTTFLILMATFVLTGWYLGAFSDLG